MKRYILNPQYKLRHENDRTYIMGEPNSSGRSTICVIHPIYAMMLSFFNGTEFENAINNISSYFHLSPDKVRIQMQALLLNKENITNGTSTFPKNIIIEYQDHIPYHDYLPNQFEYNNTDICISRLSAPNDIICNVTLRCQTSCFYCYADRKGNGNKQMPIELLEKIIEESKKLGVLRFQLMGGEVLLYKEWERALRKLSECGFHPWISTKMPLSKEQILIMKELNFISPLQISLDTLIKDNLYKILNVSDPYYENMLKTFELLEKYELKYMIHTVLNKNNSSISDINSLIDFLSTKKYLVRWGIDPAKCSMYIGTPYSSYKAPDDKIKEIEDYIIALKNKKHFPFEVSEPSVSRDINTYSIEDKKRIFENRNLCSANLNALYILPDGKVTICEELYWHPRFLLGDLHDQSIEDIWNSEKAKNLFFLKQSDIQDSSPCKTCEDFSTCKKYLHTCWRNTILAYGADKWDYPDIFCPKAPFVKNTVYI